jgi:hypothetical protein
MTTSRLKDGGSSLLTALALLVAGCGGGDQGSTTSTGSDTKPTRGFGTATVRTVRVVNGCRIEPHTICPNADLSGISIYRARLDDAILRGAHLDNADLSRATFDRADLTGADLSGATVNRGTAFNGAKFENTVCPNGAGVTSPESC